MSHEPEYTMYDMIRDILGAVCLSGILLTLTCLLLSF